MDRFIEAVDSLWMAAVQTVAPRLAAAMNKGSLQEHHGKTAPERGGFCYGVSFISPETLVSMFDCVA